MFFTPETNERLKSGHTELLELKELALGRIFKGEDNIIRSNLENGIQVEEAEKAPRNVNRLPDVPESVAPQASVIGYAAQNANRLARPAGETDLNAHSTDQATIMTASSEAITQKQIEQEADKAFEEVMRRAA